MNIMDTKKKYKGVITPPIFGVGERGALLGSRARLRKGTMGPPKPKPRYQLMVETTKVEPRGYNKKYASQTETKVSDSIALNRKLNKEMGAKKSPATKKPVAKKKPKTQAQRRYEEQIKARKKRQKKDPLGRD